MLEKLEQELLPLKRRAEQSIVELEREDFRNFLFQLEMLLGPKPVKRDEQDAQDFLDLLFPPRPHVQDHNNSAEMDVRAKQKLNQERMAVFIGLVKTLLLLESDKSLSENV